MWLICCPYYRNSKNIVEHVTGGKNGKTTPGGHLPNDGYTRFLYEEARHAITGTEVTQFESDNYRVISKAIKDIREETSFKQSTNINKA